MKHTFLGSTGLRMGNLGLGTLTWGRDTEASDAAQMVSTLLDHGGSTVDISPVYGEGLAAQVLGSVLDGGVDRSELTIVAHVGEFYHDDGAVRFNGGRGAIMDSLHGLLETLGTTYVDVLHVGSADPRIEMEEQVDTIALAVSSGATRYIGLANHPAWKVARIAQYLRDMRLPALGSIGVEYSVLQREPAGELTDVAKEFGLGILAQAPLAGGVLTGKYRHTIPATSRAATEHLSATVNPYLTDKPRRTVEAIVKAADGLARTPADVSLAWLLAQPQVTCALIGARTHAQLEQVLSLDIVDLPEPVRRVITEIA
ncbi:aryl-alcohol dehydrogenase-like predicted oxidoreductase [Trueperella bonasi]|uniref:Aryl-alcohol dehydrogenase-like predicted oxidoreductase n=1 Tax=Trueperella bonasi TaxID=312286 RepID=A0ABT9NDS6_9ACTO|nr:aldo/keto reductase [Trueperella bonasi]MDP9805525.1 aryl-alcohol dehydrogenase-like predicted oxidoreductase [Trueperella bonasi]